MEINKKAVFFSSDALIAISLIFLVILIAIPLTKRNSPSTEIHRDLLESLSSIKISELNNSYSKSLIESGDINDFNKSVLEQIGEFYVSNISIARYLAYSILDELDVNKNIGIWYENDLIASKNSSPITSAKNIDTTRQIISGIREGSSITGFSARTFLSNSIQTNYYYFGGYVGDGNISLNVVYNGNISSARLELVINNDFELFVNNVSQGVFSGSLSEFEPVVHIIPTNSFLSGDNFIEFKGEDLYIAGGFFKIAYAAETEFYEGDFYYFPGVEGLMNIYDSFYSPENITSMNISLHMNSPFETFLIIGNTTVYNGTTIGEEEIIISDSVLSSLFDYSLISQKTIPIRLGLSNSSFAKLGENVTREVVSVTDLSGSMAGSMMTNAKLANGVLVDFILNLTKGYVGLVGYETTAKDSDLHYLSQNNSSLRNVINNVWDANGYTCICCGINKALTVFLSGEKKMNYYSFDGNVLDNFFLNNGSVVGDPTYETGIANSSITFNGNDYVNLGNLDLSTEGTVSFWFKLDKSFNSSSSTTLAITGKYLDNYNNFFIVLKGADLSAGSGSRGSIQTKMESGWFSTTYAHTTTNSWNQGEWYHIAYTWGSGTTRVFVNGIQQNSVSSSRTLDFLGDNEIGRVRFDTSHISGNRYFNGSLDDFRFYPNELNQTEISYLANKNPFCGNSQVESGEICDSEENLSCFLNSKPGVKTCNSQCTGFSECNTSIQKVQAMIVMSDGEANRECSEQDTGNAKTDAIQAACDIYEDYGITVHAVGFGSAADESTLQQIAQCGGGDYFFGDVDEIVEIYEEVARTIIEASYENQTIYSTITQGTKLYPDSYISFARDSPEQEFGLIVTDEIKFHNSTLGNFSVPENSTVVDVKVVSYSGPRWTKEVNFNNNEVYSITDYGNDFIQIGDPYLIDIPNSFIEENNFVELITASNPSDSSPGSENNKIISKFKKQFVAYSSISPLAEGCIWTIEFEDYSNITAPIPSDYSGTSNCYYTSLNKDYNENDAIQNAVYELLKQIDLNKNNRIEIKFTEQDLQIDATPLTGIPFSWSTEVQIRTWS